MKTIFIPISARQQARNVLRTDIMKTLEADPDVRVVVCAPPPQAAYYKKEFSGRDIIIEETDISDMPLTKLDHFFHRLSLFYINSNTVRFLRRKWILHERREPLRCFLSLTLLSFFGTIRSLRRCARFLDERLVRDNRLDRIFNTYLPDLVFTPRITSTLDRAFLRHAKKYGVKTAGMISAWDNITLAKYPFRLLPDKLVCYNEIIQKEANYYLDIREENTVVTGLPHFDFYVNHKRASREKLCARLGIEPEKRVLLFSSVGSTSNPTEWQVLELLKRSVEAGELPRDVVFVFRQHPTQKEKMKNIPASEHIVVDDSKTTFTRAGKAFSEILSEDMGHLADSLYHASVLITTTSTMSIDAAVFDTPVINIAFDGWEKRPLYASVRRKFTHHHTHYQQIAKSGGVKIARSPDELVAAINAYLADPTGEEEGRRRIILEQCHVLDGNSGARVGNYLLSCLYQTYVNK